LPTLLRWELFSPEPFEEIATSVANNVGTLISNENFSKILKLSSKKKFLFFIFILLFLLGVSIDPTAPLKMY